ncbi:MAG: hypothetical protein AB7E67_15265 [Xanthobacteraceae bacterium]
MAASIAVAGFFHRNRTTFHQVFEEIMTTTSCSRTAAIGIAFCLLLMGAESAGAQLSSAQQDALKSNCRGDFFSYCMSTSPGSPEALKCLQTNVGKLSAGCQTAVKATMPPPAAAAPPPPKADPPPPRAATAPPPAAAAPPPRVVTAPAPPATAAPNPPRAAAAPPPRSAPPPKRAAAPPPPAAAAPPAAPVQIRELSLRERAALSRQCSGDQQALCGQVRPGGNRVVECLVIHRQSLSPACRAAVASAIR